MMRDTTPIFHDLILDSFLFRATVDHLQQKRPRLAFVGFGETDEWAHAGRYDLYLESAHNVGSVYPAALGNRAAASRIPEQDDLYNHRGSRPRVRPDQLDVATV